MHSAVGGGGGETKGEDPPLPPHPHQPASVAQPVKTLPRPAYEGDKEALIKVCGWGGSGDVDEARDLIARGIDIDEQNKNGATALMNAVTYNRYEITPELIRAGAALDLQNNKGQTALQLAREIGCCTKIVTLMEEAEAAAAEEGSVNEADTYAREGKAQETGEGKGVDAPPPRPLPPSSAATRPVKTLPRPAYEGALIKVCMSRVPDVDEARDLIARGINIDEQNDGYTALMCAVDGNHLEIARELIRAGAALDVQDEFDGRTALMWAAMYNKLEIVQELIRAGAALDLQNKNGNTALMDAVRYKSDAIATMLLEAGASCPGYKRSGVFNSKCKFCRESNKGHRQ